jgi:hypothetical protein
MFDGVRSVLSEIMVTGRISMKFVMTLIYKKGCHVYISANAWLEVAHTVG